MANEPLRQRLWHLLSVPTKRTPASLLALAARLIPPPLRSGASRNFVLIRHPLPTYRTHLVAVARRACRDFLAGVTAEELADVVALAAAVARERGIERPALVTNVGEFQTVGQLHFHLVDEAELMPLERRTLAFGASPLDGAPGAVASLALDAIEHAQMHTRGARASRLFLFDVGGPPRQPAVAIEIGGERRA